MTAHLDAMASYRDEMGITPLLERAQPARIAVEPIADGEDLGDMVRCIDCRTQGTNRCKHYIPHLAAVAQRCVWFTSKGGR